MTQQEDTIVTEHPPSLAQLALEALAHKEQASEIAQMDARRQQWTAFLTAATANVRRIIGREPEQVHCPEPQHPHQHTREAFFLIEGMWLAWVAEHYHDVSGDGKLILGTDKCVSHGQQRWCATLHDLPIRDLTDLGRALKRCAPGSTIPRPGSTSHWHYDDAGHLIDSAGYERDSSYWPTWVERTTRDGLLPNGKPPIPYED